MTSERYLFEKYETALLACDLFKGLRKEEWLELLHYFHEEKWKKHTCILNHEKFLFHFYIITSGRLKMYTVDKTSRKEHTLFLLKQADVFDLFCLLDGCKHEVYYECLDSVQVLAIPMDRLRAWLNLDTRRYKNFLSVSARMMRALENSVCQLLYATIATRLLTLLVDHIDQNSNRLKLINDLPNKELASLIGSTRAVVNRHLQELKKNGSITTARNQLEIRDISLLLGQLESSVRQKK